MDAIVPIEMIERKIYLIRGQKVMLDSDLAELYGVSTKVLIQAVKRNIKTFPIRFHVSIEKSRGYKLEVYKFRPQVWSMEAEDTFLMSLPSRVLPCSPVF